MAPILRSFGHLLHTFRSILVNSSSPKQVEIEIRGILDDLESIERTMGWIKAALKDAEEREVRGEELVREWLSDLQRLSYRGSDLLGVYEYEAIAREVRDRELETQKASSSSTAGKRKFHQVHDCSSSPLLDPSFRQEFALGIRKFREELYTISQYKDIFLFDHDDAERKSSRHDIMFDHQPSGSEPDDDELFVGRDENIHELLSLLLTDDMNEVGKSTVPVIALVGMGGVGKTTLAQHAFNHADVTKHFSTKGWICVSDNFDVTRLTRNTMEALNVRSAFNNEEFSTLQRILKNTVRENKFLLVLDDVWNEDARNWESFYSCLRHGAKGSMIIVTTRIHIVARKMQPIRCIDVNCLSDEDGWALFQKIVFGNHTRWELEHPRLVAIGKEIATKCKGLPLAIKVLGRYLRHEYEDDDTWKQVLESDLWDENMWGEGKQVLGPLSLSYLHLPAHLKPCFVISSVFPKDTKIRKECLVDFWIAHGLVEDDSKENGMRYIKSLLSRSFFLPTYSINEGDDCVMTHDLMHDLAEYLLRDKVFRIVDNQILDTHIPESDRVQIRIPQEAHHAFIGNFYRSVDVHLSHDHNYISSLRTLEASHTWKNDYMLDVESPERAKVDGLRILTYRKQTVDINGAFLLCFLRNMRNLRTLKIYGQVKQPSNIVMDTICTLYNLRVLMLSSEYIQVWHKWVINLPEAIGNLRNLTYLHITYVENVPESVCRLRKLHILNLRYALISYLPECICELINLERLDLSFSYIKVLPDSIGKLKALTVLDLYSCMELLRLPRSLSNLINLTKLDVDDVPKGCYFPCGFGYLTKLQDLPIFRVAPKISDTKHAAIEDLRNIAGIRNSLYISGLCNVVSQEDAPKNVLVNKRYISRLDLHWSDSRYAFTGGSSSREHGIYKSVASLDEQVLENLRPHVNITWVEISWWRGRRLASWLGDESFVKLQCIHLRDLPYCACLSPLHHLPYLEYLFCKGMPSLVCLTTSSLMSHHCEPDIISMDDSEPTMWNIFPMLKGLHIGPGCARLTSLDAISYMPSITELDLGDCSSLTSIPRLPLIEDLGICQFSGQLDHLSDSLSFLVKLKMSRCASSWCIPLHKLRSLEKILLSKCPNMWFPDDVDELPSSMEEISIEDSPRLKEWCLTHRHTELAHLQWCEDLTSGTLILQDASSEIKDCLYP